MKRQMSGREPSRSVNPYSDASRPEVTDVWFHLRHESGSLLDRFRTVVVGLQRPDTAAAAGADDGRAGLAQGGSDSAPSAPCRPRDDAHPPAERVRIR
jgi:hypothetical protein